MSRQNKVLFVTGASSEIGYQLINSIIGNYSKIYAHYRNNSNRIQALVDQYDGKIIPVKADLSKEDDIESVLNCFFEMNLYPDHFVHLAAEKLMNKQFHKCTWEMYQSSIDINFKSAVILLEKLIPRMTKERYGKVIFVLTSHTLGRSDAKYQSPYITSKYALLGLLRNLAGEYSDKGITVNGISPDMIETDFLSGIPSKIVEINAQNSPIKRNIKVDEVVAGIDYLLSDYADCVSGQNIGITCR